MSLQLHPILLESFAVIDQEVGEHGLDPDEYAILRRIIHSTADFEFKTLLRFSETAIEAAIAALTQSVPIITDVNMVKQGIQTTVAQTFSNPVVAAIDWSSGVGRKEERERGSRGAGEQGVLLDGEELGQREAGEQGYQAVAPAFSPSKTRTETGLLRCWQAYPEAIYVIGNAPTALLALCDQIQQLPDDSPRPALVIGAPVGFISVVESKQALAHTAVPKILIEGRKGGSGVAAAIVNALLVLAWERVEERGRKGAGERGSKGFS